MDKRSNTMSSAVDMNEDTPLLCQSINSSSEHESYETCGVDEIHKTRTISSGYPYSDFQHSVYNSALSSLINSIASTRKLQKSVGCLQGFMLLIGIIIGSGIFLSPNIVVHEVHDFGLSLLIWLISGLIVLMGALCYCELGCAIQRAGGNYAFILFIYGPVPAFLTSWTFSLLVDPTGIATICLTLGTYVMKPFTEDEVDENLWYPKAMAAGAIVLMALTNSLSIKLTTRLQAIFGLCQILSVLFLISLGVWQISIGNVQNFKGMLSGRKWDWELLGSVGIAFYGSLWAYNGWQYVSNITEEIKNVERNLFLSVVTAVPFIIICYVAVNIALMSGLTSTEIAASPAVGVDFVRKLLGRKASYVMPVLVALSCYGSANGAMFACGRVSLAAGREGHMPEILGMIHRTRYTPIPAIFMTSCIALLMLVPNANDLQTLVTFTSVSMWCIYTLSIIGVVVLRFRRPDLHRPYKTWIFTPIFMSLVGIFLVAIPFVQRPFASIAAVGFILFGLPVYYAFVHCKPHHPKWFSAFCKTFTDFIQEKLGLAKCAV